MRKCPNCGRRTVRTSDYACRWCGYPLLSGSYQLIPRTYKELKDEGEEEELSLNEARAAGIKQSKALNVFIVLVVLIPSFLAGGLLMEVNNLVLGIILAVTILMGMAWSGITMTRGRFSLDYQTFIVLLLIVLVFCGGIYISMNLV